MQHLVEDFLQYLRHERGQSDNTAKTYAALLGKFTAWAEHQGLADWHEVELKHLMGFLQNERSRPLADEPKESTKRMSSESVYLEIAALRAFYKFAENEKLLPANLAENLSLPRRWKRLPKALSNEEIAKLLRPEEPATPDSLCDQAILELAYASGLRLSELKNLRLEQLHLDAGFINVIGKGNKERVVPVGKTAIAALNRFIEVGRPKLITPKTPANIFLNRRGSHAVAAHQEPGETRGHRAQRHAPHVATQLCHALAGARRGFAGNPGTAGPREHRHDGDLHARRRQPIAGNSPQIPSASLSRRVGGGTSPRHRIQ
jgi:integrase/recombinase XerD